jgi:uncharacterized protein YndB with AHSA1/START domain
MHQQTSETVIQKSVSVAVPVEQAFRVFTDEIGVWWPVETFSVDPGRTESIVLEGWEGGRIVERTSTGDEHIWGTVLTWEPPSRLVCTWHPGRDGSEGHEVEVTFVPEGDGTRVGLSHRGWENVVDQREERMASYVTGWDLVLSRYVEAANG